MFKTTKSRVQQCGTVGSSQLLPLEHHQKEPGVCFQAFSLIFMAKFAYIYY